MGVHWAVVDTDGAISCRKIRLVSQGLTKPTYGLQFQKSFLLYFCQSVECN